MTQQEIVAHRKRLPHQVPPWVDRSAVFFVTVCALPRGRNTLCQPNLAERLWETVVFRQKLGHWWVHLFLLMPGTLHMLVSFPDDRRMDKVVSGWKRYLARQESIQWQRDFFRPPASKPGEPESEIRIHPAQSRTCRFSSNGWGMAICLAN